MIREREREREGKEEKRLVTIIKKSIRSFKPLPQEKREKKILIFLF